MERGTKNWNEYHALSLARSSRRQNVKAYIATGHHNGIRLLNNVVIIFQSLLVFDLGNDLNVRTTIVGQQFLEVANIISSSDKGSGNVLDLKW